VKYFSLFSGIGGFELGIQRSCFQNKGQSERMEIRDKKGQLNELPKWSAERYTCIGFSEVDKYATQIYKKHFNHKEYGDVSKIKWNDVEDFDLLCGGFPCQSFSIAGRRGGFDDTRGTLFFEIARAAQEKQPRLLLLENVKGLLSSNKGKTFGTILNTLDEFGYDLQWQVLNSKNFGVPQNRERVFIIGHLRGTGGRQIFPIRGEYETSDGELAKTIMARDYKGIENQEMTLVEKTENQSQGYRVYDPNGISTTLAAQAGEIGAKTGLYEIEDCKIRRLTPTECERLQGFPDGWTEKEINEKGEEVCISDTQRYKCLGNAVTVNVIEAIVRELLCA
jgi:DNA (cytosine-5)-methyltransferase 1